MENKKHGALGLVVGIIVALALIGGGAYWWQTQNPATSPSEPTDGSPTSISASEESEIAKVSVNIFYSDGVTPVEKLRTPDSPNRGLVVNEIVTTNNAERIPNEVLRENRYDLDEPGKAVFYLPPGEYLLTMMAPEPPEPVRLVLNAGEEKEIRIVWGSNPPNE